MPKLSVSGSTLHYQIHELTAPWVEQPQAVLFHHGLGSTSGLWSGWLPALIERYRVASFDMRGHGKSAHPSKDAPLSLELLVDDLFAVADAAGVERFHLVGESIGGTIALLAALKRPDRVRTLTVSNGAHMGGSIRSIDDWRQIIEARGMSGWSDHMMQARFFEGGISEDLWRWYQREQAAVDPELTLRAVRLLAGADLSAQLSAVRMPVLLMHGDSSPFIPVSVMADLKAKLPNARLQVFARAKHGLPFSHAAACAQTLRRFLDETNV